MQSASEAFKANWVKKRLQLVRHHPDVVRLENEVWEFCRDFSANPLRGRRMILFGNNGNGKSKSCRAIRRWIQDRAIDLPLVLHDDNAALCTCEMVNWPATVDNFKTGDWSIDHLLEADLLIIDDLGAEHDPSKVGLEKLYLILERREWRWMIITTNLSPEFWEERFERRITDRLFRNCKHVDLSRLPSYSINT